MTENHTPEMIAALIIASTALMGLTGLFFCYIRFSREAQKGIHPDTFREIRIGLSYSMASGIAVIILSLFWYLNISIWLAAFATFIFLLQIAMFVDAAYYLRLFIFR